jgi:hypothetical protein
LDEAVQNVNELDAYHGLDQNRCARPPLVLIDLPAEYERETEPHQSLHNVPTTFGALAAIQQRSGEILPSNDIQGFARTRCAMDFGSRPSQEDLQAARNKRLFLDHKDRAAGERSVFHDRSSARGNAHLPNSPLT